MAAIRLNELTRSTFVKSGVKETELTTQILNTIYPFYPKDTQCISGYLDVSDQYWKVNFHWDYLLFFIDTFLTLRVGEDLKGFARSIRLVLMSNPPNPQTGYRTDKHPGDTVDTSTAEIVKQRHKILLQCKLDFRRVLLKANIIDLATEFSGTPKAVKPWWLSIARVASPGDSKHGTGYAVDIKGDNARITEISKALGASLVYNESSHVHVEFKNFKLD